MKEAEITTGFTDECEPDEVDTPVEPGAVDTTDDDVAADGSGPESADDSGARRTRSDGGELADPRTVVERTVEHERERVETLLDKDEGLQHAAIREDLQDSMTENVNVFRNEAGLKTALEDIREARERYQDVYVDDPSRTFNTDLLHTMETRNLIDLAEAITLGALARDEFRGAHWRQEYQERRDDVWLKHTLLRWNDGDPELFYKPVILEGEDKTYEPKVRSY
jgi:succinate dehydrogenase / fumarate reductase flavoprotein subunit